MSLNPQYDTIGRSFVHQYYMVFDDPAQRANLASFYNEEKSLMTFEGQQLFGRIKIMEKIQGLTFQKIQHQITSIDPQPMFDGGILICVLGQLKIIRKDQQDLTLALELVRHGPHYENSLAVLRNVSELRVTIHHLMIRSTDEDPPHTFNQTFVLKPLGDGFYVEHDVFRLALHHTA